MPKYSNPPIPPASNPLAVRLRRQMLKDNCTSMRQLAKSTGIMPDFIQDVFHDVERITDRRRIAVERLAQYLETSPNQIYVWAGTNPKIRLNESRASYCAYVRKKLHLTKREASYLFGLGKNAFGEIEAGQREPSYTLLMLLNMLDKHPDLLKELTSFSAKLNAAENA